MKIIIEDIPSDAEEEIIIRASNLDESLMKLIYSIKARRDKIVGYLDGSMMMLELKSIYYFEVVDNRVFAYCEAQVYEVKTKLYELEQIYEGTDFFRASKSAIVNLSKIKSLTPSFNGRFEAILKNGEHTIISRQYVGELKKKLGL